MDDFATIFEQYRSRIYRYLCHLVHDAELAEDLAQETFLKAYRALSQKSRPENMSAWLYAIASNTAFSALRRRKLIAWLPFHGNAEVARKAARSSHEARLGERELVAQALAKLPERDAACLLLHFEQGLSCAEVAEVLGMSPTAAKTRLYRARAAFCRAYQGLSREVEA